MVDVGTAPGSTNVAKLVVLPNFPNTLVVIGADQGPGTSNGPSRKVEIFEDLTLKGNLDGGVVRAVRFHLHDGGVVPHMTETPRLSTEVSSSELSIIGAGRADIPNARSVKIYDNLTVARDLVVSNGMDVTGTSLLSGGLTVVGDVAVDGDVNVGALGNWHTVKAKNVVYASGTFHLYDRGSGAVAKMCCGYGFDAITPIAFLPGGNANYGPLTGLPVAVVKLDASIAQAVVSITPWVLGQYNELTPPTVPPVFMATAAPFPDVAWATLTVKGDANPTGALPSVTNAAQQIEIAFWEGASFIVPVFGAPATDIVFDLTVTGYLVP